nr:hypothetical protein [Bacteroidota bacterium]
MGLAAGTYTVTVTDANGCTATCSYMVTQPAAALTATCSGTNVACFGASTGSASVVAAMVQGVIPMYGVIRIQIQAQA